MITPRNPQRHPATVAWEKWKKGNYANLSDRDYPLKGIKRAFLDGYEAATRHRAKTKPKKGKV